MWKNYLKITYRNLKRNKGYTFINVAGLAIGLACCLLIALYVSHELSYDRFHEKADRLYRVVQEQRFGTTQQVAVTAGRVGPALKAEYPDVEHAVRFFLWSDLLRRGEKLVAEEMVAVADSNVFDAFTFPLVRGNPATALDKPNSLVLTESAARKYFGSANPMGETMRFSDLEMHVTGVMKDVPPNAHFHFDALASFSTIASQPWVDTWGTNTFYTYVLLRPGASPEGLNAKLPVFTKKYRGAETLKDITYYLQPLTDIHLRSHMVAEAEANGDITTVYIFSAIALFILLIAAINYTNLATARSTQRMREVGMRKMLGAHRTQLITQFLGESLLLTLLAVVAAVALVGVSLPLVSPFLEMDLSSTYVTPLTAIAGLAGFSLLVGLLAGAYPAVHLSRFRPASVLKGTLPVISAGAGFRKGLVVLQFAISIVLIVAVGTTYQQLRYVQNKHLGFDKEHLVRVDMQDASSPIKRVKAVLEKLPQVMSVAASGQPLGGSFSQTTFRPEGTPEEQDILMSFTSVDPSFIETAGMAMAAGRSFERTRASDSTDAVVINETAVRSFGWTSPQEALSKRIVRAEDTTTVIGVVQDFHFASLHQTIEPLVMRWRPSQLDNVIVRMRPENVSTTLASLEKAWTHVAPDQPFAYSFVDERLDRLYGNDEKLGQLFSIFAILAIVIACLGLFGLTTFATERRMKEIGVRKVFGASATSIVVLLSKDFLKLVGIAFVLAAPVAYYAMNRWLEDFAYRIELGPWVFLLTGVIVFVIALATVSYQALRAALTDPVESLRYE